MKVAIMQPYFFPYLGYFQLIASVDEFVIYDTAQFPKQGWVNRNRICSEKSGWEYITVPLMKSSFVDSYKTAIELIKVSSASDWRGEILSKVSRYKQYAPWYDEVKRLVSRALDCPYESISRINVHCLESVAEYLGINFNPIYCSELKLGLSHVSGPQSKVLRICEHLGAQTYVNLPGGMGLYDSDEFNRHSIGLEFLGGSDFCYKVNGFQFEPKLSVIDVLMWNDPSRVAEMCMN